MPQKRKREEKVSKAKNPKRQKQTNGQAKVQTSGVENSKPTYSCWLVKSEPESRMEKGVDMKFSFDDLKSSPGGISCWDGVRNYQARNFLRDQMKPDHDVLFYHSNTKEPGIVGICKVVKGGYPDHTQFDPKDPHYDRSSPKDNPRWFMVDVEYVRPLKHFVSLATLKIIHREHAAKGGPLKNLALFTKARLSVQPLTREEWDFILSLENEKAQSR